MADSPDDRDTIAMMKARSKTILKRSLIAAPLVFVLLVFASAYWLFNSKSGASLLWAQLESASGGQVRAERTEGDLADGFIVHGLNYVTEDMNITIGRTEIRARPGIWPLSIVLPELFLQDIAITRIQVTGDEQDNPVNTDFRSAIEALQLPIPVYVQRIELKRIAVRDADENPFLTLDTVAATLELDDSLTIEELQVSSNMVDIEAHAGLSLSRPFKFNVSLQGELVIPGLDGDGTLSLPLKVESSGDLNKLQLNALSEPSGLFVTAAISSPLRSLEWDITGELDQSPQALSFSGQAIVIEGLTFASQGSFQNWKLELASGLKVAGQPDSTLDMVATGSGPIIYIEHSAINGSGIELELNGELDAAGQSDVGLHVVIHRLDLSHWMTDWPRGETLNGELVINSSADSLNISESRIGVTGTDFEARMSADIDVDANRVDASVDWKNFDWPLKTETTQLFSPTGQLDIEGSIDQWLATGLLQVKLGDYPQAQLQIEGTGDRYSGHINLLDGEVLGGRLSGMADADWQNVLSWRIDLQASDVDPGPLLNGWPGQLDAKLSVEADGREGHFNFEIEELGGLLRGQHISARGGLELTGENLTFRELDLRTDDAQLQVDGSISDSTGATFNFHGKLPGVFLQGASGNLALDGRISSHPDDPLLEVQMQGLDLAWKEMRIKALALNTGDSQPGYPLPAIELNAIELQWKDQYLQEVTLTHRPDGGTSRLDASLVNEFVDLTTQISLNPESMTDVLGGAWQGKLETLVLVVARNYAFELVEPSSFTWSAGSFSLQSACLADTQRAGLCAEFTYGANGDLSLNADIKEFPVDYLRELSEIDVGFEQKLDGELEWQQPAGEVPAGSVDFRISAGRIMDLVDDETIMESSEGRLGFALRGGNLEAGALDIKFPDVGFIDVDFDVIDFALDGKQQLKGRVVSQLNDIALIGQLALPGMDDTSGQFDSDIRLGGSLADPQFDGGFRLSNGLFYYAPVGLRLEDVNFTGKLEKRDRGTLEGQFRLGQGIGTINGSVLFENAEQAKLDLDFSGEQLLMINTSNFKMLTDTDINIALSPGRLDINGHVRVPSAHLTPSNLIINTVNDSEDLVIVKSHEQESKTTAETSAKTEVFGNLEVSFGEDVNVKFPGVDTDVTGSVTYDWSGDPIPLANGNYYLKGMVDVYGPRLEIANGTIAFPGIRADNPLLNIRAQREIFGNTQIRSAGVQLIGTLKRPVVEAYTVPVTNEDRAWTLLVTGSDFDQGQGVSGFDVGTYIAPRLYVSYGISLFEDENVISARYDLKKGFGIKVTSGQRETGLDISYTVDK